MLLRLELSDRIERIFVGWGRVDRSAQGKQILDLYIWLQLFPRGSSNLRQLVKKLNRVRLSYYSRASFIILLKVKIIHYIPYICIFTILSVLQDINKKFAIFSLSLGADKTNTCANLRTKYTAFHCTVYTKAIPDLWFIYIHIYIYMHTYFKHCSILSTRNCQHIHYLQLN